MEVKDYIRFLSKNYIAVIIITLTFALITYLITIAQPNTYQSSASLEVIKLETKPQSETPYFQYDNYYSYQAASAASDNLIGWIESAATVAQVYNKAGYQIPSANIKDLSKTFTATKTVGTSAIVSISYSSKDVQEYRRDGILKYGQQSYHHLPYLLILSTMETSDWACSISLSLLISEF